MYLEVVPNVGHGSLNEDISRVLVQSPPADMESMHVCQVVQGTLVSPVIRLKHNQAAVQNNIPNTNVPCKIIVTFVGIFI